MPAGGAIDVTGLTVDAADMAALTSYDARAWEAEVEAIEGHYARFDSTLPPELAAQLANLKKQVGSN